MPRKARLFVRGFKSIGIVDAPACEGSEIVVAKRREGAPTEDPPMSTKKTDTAPTVEELAAKVADLTAQLAAKDTELAAAKAAATPPPSTDEVLKSLDGPARDLVLKAQADAAAATAKAEEAQKAADRERDIRETGEYVTTAKRFERVAGKAEDFGPLLRRLERNEGTAEDHKRLREVLAGAEKIAADSKAFGEIGRSGASGEGDTAIEKANARAVDLVSKGKATDIAAGLGQVFRDDPELYAAYRTETTTRV